MANDPHRIEGRYANAFEIGYTAYEFLLDFSQVYNGGDTAVPHTRIITAAEYAHVLLELLEQSISEYERSYGQIVRPRHEGDSE